MMSSGAKFRPRLRAARLAGLWLLLALALAGRPALAAPVWPVTGSPEAAEPFGMTATAQPDAALLAKWQTLARESEAEQEVVALCAEARQRCASAAALRLLDLAEQARALPGRARIGVINRAINMSIHFAADADADAAGASDDWAAPLATLERGAGDCEDYAVAKLAALRLAGVAPDDLRLAIIRDERRDEDHAVAAVRLDGRWLILDNRRLVLLDDSELRGVRAVASVDALGTWRHRDSGPEAFQVAAN